MQWTNPLFRVASAAAVLGAMATTSHAVTFRLRGQIDTAALGAGAPGSVAAYGNRVYFGNLFGSGRLHHVTDPLTTPTLVNTFGGLNDPALNGGLPSGPGLTTDGYVSLHTDGQTLVAATTNGGRVDNSVAISGTPDIIQSYAFGSDVLQWGSNSDILDIGGVGYFGQGNGFGDLSISGAAVDPISGNIVSLAWGSAEQYIFAPDMPVPDPLATPSLFYIVGTTGWRDLSFDQATGDVVAIAARGIVRGRRVAGGDYDYTTLDGSTAGLERIVPFATTFDTAVNVAYLPSDFAGENLVIFNRRGEPDTFTDQVKVFSADAVNVPVTVNFVQSDGTTPFSTFDATSGIYDFSYDPVQRLLYVSDFSTSQIHIFGVGSAGPTGDFNNDGLFNCADINALTNAVATGGSVTEFDLNGDGQLSLADVDAWRSVGGAVNLGAGRSYRVGDANLDGVVDGSDFGAWNSAKFTGNTAWCSGNFNADGVIDGSDFGLWNGNKFTSSDDGVVPEPAGWALAGGLVLLQMATRRRIALRPVAPPSAGP